MFKTNQYRIFDLLWPALHDFRQLFMQLLGRMYFKLIIVFHSLFSRRLVLYPDSPISTPNPFDRFLLQIHSLDKRSLSALSVLSAKSVFSLPVSRSDLEVLVSIPGDIQLYLPKACLLSLPLYQCPDLSLLLFTL